MKDAKKKTKAKEAVSSNPEKVSAEGSLERMKEFSKRKEKIIAFILKSKN
jgi:hypothetical protein